jgi:predicted secreted protein
MEGSLNDKISESPGEIWLQESALFFFLCIFIVIPQVGLCNGKVVTGDNVIIITKQDNGKEIKVKSGDVIQIELEAICTAGYGWYMDKFDSTHLELLSEETKAISEKGKTGEPAKMIWRFKVLKIGSSSISMDYYRKWEGRENAVDHFSIKIDTY